ELRNKLDSFAAEHAEFRRVHVSRRGVEGPRGEQGIPGQSIVGPKGEKGDPARLAIGTVTLGEQASARIEDTPDGQVLHLVLPLYVDSFDSRDFREVENFDPSQPGVIEVTSAVRWSDKE